MNKSTVGADCRAAEPHLFMPYIVIMAVVLTTTVAASQSSPGTTIDWAARTTGQQACVSPSATTTVATLKLVNANPILYTYDLNVKSYAIPGDDGAILTSLPPTKGGANPLSCQDFNAAVRRIWSSSLFPKDRRSVPLEETQSLLQSESRDIDAVTAGIPDQCTADDPAAANAEIQYLPLYNETAKQLSSSSSITFSYSEDNKHYNDFSLRERTRFSNKKTDASLHWRCGFDDVLTLSVGTLLTTLQYRTYSSQSVPTSSGGTQNELVVSGTGSWTPIGVALLNYKLLDTNTGPQFSLSASAG